MGVHSLRVNALERGMRTGSTPDTLPFEAGDPEWLADLFDALRAVDLDSVVGQFEELSKVMRKAGRDRGMLASLDPELVGLGPQVRAACGAVS